MRKDSRRKREDRAPRAPFSSPERATATAVAHNLAERKRSGVAPALQGAKPKRGEGVFRGFGGKGGEGSDRAAAARFSAFGRSSCCPPVPRFHRIVTIHHRNFTKISHTVTCKVRYIPVQWYYAAKARGLLDSPSGVLGLVRLGKGRERSDKAPGELLKGGIFFGIANCVK